MLAGGDELQHLQSELQAVKRALQNGGAYLGMTGETLQRYLLQLNEKENLVLSRQLQATQVQTGNAGGHAGGAARNGAAYPSQATVLQPPPPVARPQPRPPPNDAGGAPRAFDKSSLQAVLAHMCDYEAVAVESAKALKALSALAYEDATLVGKESNVQEQLRRLVALHPDHAGVQLNAMRAYRNMAYEPPVALGYLANATVLKTIVTTLSRSEGTPNESASEAVARIVSAETNPDRVEGSTGPASGSSTALTALYVAAASSEQVVQDATVKLLLQLISNEVADPKLVARSLMSAVPCVKEDHVLAAGWLALGKALAQKAEPPLPQDIADCSGINAAIGIMEAQAADGAVQLVGIEALSSMVGSRWAALQQFAEGRGIARIEAAMAAHGSVAILQTKGVRALASGLAWRDDVLEKSGYSHERCVRLTKAAMRQHVGEVELQAAALEALAKYIDKLKCVDLIASEGGDGLVKTVMMNHPQAKNIQQWGRVVLNGIGVEQDWVPQGAPQP